MRVRAEWDLVLEMSYLIWLVFILIVFDRQLFPIRAARSHVNRSQPRSLERTHIGVSQAVCLHELKLIQQEQYHDEQ